MFDVAGLLLFCVVFENASLSVKIHNTPLNFSV